MNMENLPIVPEKDESRELAVTDQADNTAGSAAAGSASDQSAGIYRLLHHSLRGRYGLAASLGVALGVVIGSAAWLMMTPHYRSESLIRISYDIPRVIQASQDYRPMDAYEAFMQSQVALISSRRVVAEALKNPQWAEIGIVFTQDSSDGFATDLKVEHKSGTEHLKVSYESKDPVTASLAVRSVTDAYVALYNSIDRKAADEKTQALVIRRDELKKKSTQLENLMRDQSVEFGSSNVDRFYDASVQQLTKVESALIDVRIAMALTQGTRQGASFRFTPQQIARFDPTMARYMAEREQLETDLERLRLRGYGEGHKQIQQVQGALDLVAQRIRDYALEYQSTQPTLAAGNPGVTQNGQPSLVGRSLDELKADETNLAALNKEIKQQMVTLGAKKLGVETTRSDLDKVRSELADVNQRLASFEVENALSGRLSVLSNGEVPLLPYRDRRLQYTAAGALGGFLFPAGLMVAVTSARRRYRDSDDATSSGGFAQIPLLGILPQLPERLTDPDVAADAAQCVHQIRVMLQVKAPSGTSNSYLVTSASPGEGKTSLVASLALSFAAAGSRTLLIDADLIGQRLTRGYRMDEKQGLREIIDGSMHGSGVYATGITRLSMIPAGISDGRDACTVSSPVMARLLDHAAKDYDVVLVDSGPILGSLEALVVAGLTDGVILTISREQQKPLVDRAIRQLHSVGARIAGMVFNKAEHRDFRRSVGVSSLRSIPKSAASGSLVKAGVTSTSGFGSLVDSVQTYLPSA